MSIIVQKFGGTSVENSKKILAAARKAIRAHKNGNQVVMVVSAMGQNTDILIDLAKQITDEPPAREMDMLLSTGEQVSVALMAMAIDTLGYKAVSMTGAQIGIKTDNTHGKARIQKIDAKRLHEALDAGYIVIAAGFQGVDDENNITTLGRGGSDTTAVALAAVLNADACEIYTDVDGVYTTDPRMVPDARRVKRISYDEMLELASAGAGIMHNRAIEFARNYDVPVHVRASYSDEPGTLIIAESETLERPVCGCACVKNEARVTVRGIPDKPGAANMLFKAISDQKIAVDMIVQSKGNDGMADISFTVPREECAAASRAVHKIKDQLGFDSCTHDDEVSMVSIVGKGMVDQPGVAQKMFQTLGDKGINILMISTSEIKISVLCPQDKAIEALRAIHDAFELDKEPTLLEIPEKPADKQEVDKVSMINRLHGMEDLFIDKIELDDIQGRITIENVPDRAGLSCQLFKQLADAGVNIDMIVQSQGKDDMAKISFTMPQVQFNLAMTICKNLPGDLAQASIANSCPQVAKLTVFGTGLKSHTNVAVRVLQCLAEAGINVGMINTSEATFNVTVPAEFGEKALKLINQEFASEIC